MTTDYDDPSQESQVQNPSSDETHEQKRVAVDHTGYPHRVHGPAPNHIGMIQRNETIIFQAPRHLGFVLCLEDERIFGESRYQISAGESMTLTVDENAPLGPFSFRTVTAKDASLEHTSCDCDSVMRTTALTTEGGGGMGGGEVGGP